MIPGSVLGDGIGMGVLCHGGNAVVSLTLEDDVFPLAQWLTEAIDRTPDNERGWLGCIYATELLQGLRACEARWREEMRENQKVWGA